MDRRTERRKRGKRRKEVGKGQRTDGQNRRIRKEMERKRETKGNMELGKDRHKDRWK